MSDCVRSCRHSTKGPAKQVKSWGSATASSFNASARRGSAPAAPGVVPGVRARRRMYSHQEPGCARVVQSVANEDRRPPDGQCPEASAIVDEGAMREAVEKLSRLSRPARKSCLRVRGTIKMSRNSKRGGCSSVGRALDCGSSGRGFKSLHSPQIS